MRSAFVLLAILGLIAPAAGARASCATAGRTVMKNRLVRVYDVKRERVYACHLASRRRTFLTRYAAGPEALDESDGFIRARLAGRYIGFGDEFGCNRLGDCSGSVRVVDARSGRDLYEGAAVTVVAGSPNAGKVPELAALHLKPNGSAAYVIGPTFDQPWEVWRLHAGGVDRLDGGSIDPASLATSARYVYWTRDGQPFSATWR